MKLTTPSGKSPFLVNKTDLFLERPSLSIKVNGQYCILYFTFITGENEISLFLLV